MIMIRRLVRIGIINAKGVRVGAKTGLPKSEEETKNTG